jgi:hypothetical protein
MSVIDLYISTIGLPILLQENMVVVVGGEGDRGSIFWKTKEIGLPSYNDLSTMWTYPRI